MTTPRQLHANRQNALKSTGPTTPEGKSATAQNAVKHGLLTSQNIINGESKDDFDLHREQLFEEFNPETPIENHLVQRIVTLTWRLKRAYRAQTAAVNSLHHSHRNKPVVKLPGIMRPKNDSPPPPDHELGDVTVKDTANYKVIDNLLLQERRIENSLYKTFAELERKQLIRKIDSENEKN
ncbi:MAG TPA: hypothetical protein ENH94_11015 [Phycisphaerales bacterium]|nr:hypothetical protein [Phycisphaerales bacterium]